MKYKISVSGNILNVKRLKRVRPGIVKIFFMIGLLIFLFPGSGLLGAEEGQGAIVTGDFETGKIIPKVVCREDSGQSYVLYLPKSYSPDRIWPILYCFEPAARGQLPVKLFIPAAETYGYIVVCSNNSRNGPWEPIATAAKAVWKDTIKRFPVDPNRVYATGLSGGSRVASHFQYIIKRPIAGVIGCGAGLSTTIKPEMLKTAAYYGTVGLEDFNFREMMRLDREFDATGVVHRVLVFDGGHHWPSEEICMRAIEWMELVGMKRGIRKKDVLMGIKLYKKALKNAEELEKAGKVLETLGAYGGAAELFDGLVDVSEVKAKAEKIRNSDGYKRFLEEDKKRDQWQRDVLSRFFGLRKKLLEGKLPRKPEKLLKVIDWKGLRSEADESPESGNVYDRALAKRLLYEMRVTAMPDAGRFMVRKDYKRAALFYRLASELNVKHPVFFYNMACAYSRVKDKKGALRALKTSVEKGFTNKKQMLADPDLDNIRKEKGFKEILKSLK